MSGDEAFVTLVSLVLGIGGWALWLYRAASFDALRRSRSQVPFFAAVVGALGLLIFIILRLCAADDVRNAPAYLFMYFVLGLAWLRLAALPFPFAGLHPHDDMIERRNAAAVPAWAGAMTGVALCYAGANVGNGPGWWVVVFSAGLATISLGGIWLALGHWTGVSDAVVIDRDLAAGMRLGGLLAACGLVFGAAVTGDWVSAPATVMDFVMRGWAALPIALIAVLMERGMRPTPERPRAPVVQAGVVPAVLYLAFAMFAVKLSAWKPS